MKKSKDLIPLILLLLMLAAASFAGCTHIQNPKPFAFPSPKVVVAGDIIYCDGKPFAQIKLFEDPDSVPGADHGDGLVMQYLANKQEVWIHPKKGITLVKDGTRYTKIDDINSIWNDRERDQRSKSTLYVGNKMLTKEDFIRNVVYNVRISPDGKYVYYKSQGMIYNSSHRFSVEAGH